MTPEIPNSWQWVVVDDVCIVNPPQPDRIPDEDELVSFVPMAAVEAGTARMDSSNIRPWKEIRKGYTRFQDGDVLFAKITPCMENGKSALAIGLTGGVGAGSTEFHVLRPSAIAPKLLLYFVLQESFRRDARAKMRGAAGQLRVPPDFMSTYPFPLPPLAEQRRIVAEIETQLTRLDAAVDALEGASANLKRYRAAVLKAACEGTLVPTEAELAGADGREYVSADALLKRVLDERRTMWEADELAKMGAAGKSPKNDKWKAKYVEPDPAKTDGLPTLPAGWVWATLKAIADLKGGVTKGQRREASDVLRPTPYLRVANVQRGYLDLREVKLIDATEDEIADLRLEPGDILFNEGGDRDKLGRGWVWQGEIADCIHQNHVFRARLFSEGIEPRFISWYANSVGQAYFMSEGKQTTNLASINLTKLGSLPVPIPPANEQRRIVEEIERRFSLTDGSGLSVDRSLVRAERLRQGVLRLAFEGRLTPQDPADEPANNLLERIRADKRVPSGTARRSRPAFAEAAHIGLEEAR
jgi:type I restriction enzyme S subunit